MYVQKEPGYSGYVFFFSFSWERSDYEKEMEGSFWYLSHPGVHWVLTTVIP